MTKIEIQLKIRQCQGELSLCQSQIRKKTHTIDELEYVHKDISSRRGRFIENRDYLATYATEIAPDYSDSSIEREYSEKIQTILKGSKFKQALIAFDRACAKIADERCRLIRECNSLNDRIAYLRREIQQLRMQLEQA